MKIILLLICIVPLLAATGCVVAGGHDHADDQEHRQYGANDEHSSGVDHGEHPGDIDHGESR